MSANVNAVEPFPAGADHFEVLGLPRRLSLDVRHLDRAFHELSRKNHPDRFATAPPRERRISLENSARVNNAHKALKDPWRRAQYLVELESGPTGTNGRPPVALFEEILELQELLSEARMALQGGAMPDGLRSGLVTASQPFRQALDSAEKRRDALFEAIDGSSVDRRPGLVSDLSALLDERRYLARVVADVDAVLEGRDSERDNL